MDTIPSASPGNPCCQPGSGCRPPPSTGGLLRRDMLKSLVTVGAATLLPGRWVWAEDGQTFASLIPPDKHLDPAWVAGLTARGTPTVSRGAGLRWIGMPVGGLCAGLVYLSGDGRLWLWDVRNARKQGIDGKPGHYQGKAVGPRDGAAYVEPRAPASPFQQGFAIRWRTGTTTGSRQLDASGAWADIAFTGSYPIGRVAFRDASVPVQVDLEAFSPFIPLDTADSSLPATIMRYTIANPGSAPVTVELAGWLENRLDDQDGLRGVLQPGNRLRPVAGATVVQAEPGALPAAAADLAKRDDVGTMALAILDGQAQAFTALPAGEPAAAVFTADGQPAAPGNRIGAVRHALTIPPGGHVVITAVVSWHFPNLHLKTSSDQSGRWYATRFADAAAVIAHIARELPRLYGDTVKWHDTWYGSTLPYWLLERTLLNTSIIASTTCFRFGDGRFWAWEGVGCCEGTCTHVWGYAQAMARLFPDLERDLRQRTDFGLAFNPATGVIRMRGEQQGLAIDGQAMVILRTWREHRMATDAGFLRGLWPRVKRAVECLMERDQGDGLLRGAQHNTLDTDWYGEVAWLTGLYLAALGAAAAMAEEMDDGDFATTCRTRLRAGRQSLTGKLFNGEYFVNHPDPGKATTVNSGTGCHIDQVLGQQWAWQAGLGRILPERETRTALASLWKYNFAPDVGPWRQANKPGRWYATPGEMGLVMCTFPRPDWDYAKATGKGRGSWAAMYFNECMSGFEWQVAAHMVHEGMLTEGLAIARAIHDRYAPAKRNPYNEIECSDHYARAMASYGVFIALCGFDGHGPGGHLGFAPRLSPEKFQAAFTCASGWGSYSQAYGAAFTAAIHCAHGTVRLATLAVRPGPGPGPTTVTALVDRTGVAASVTLEDGTATIRFTAPITLQAGQVLAITLH